MSQENVEIVRGIFERWGEGDFRAGTDLFDPHVVLVLRPEFPDSGAYLAPKRSRLTHEVFSSPGRTSQSRRTSCWMPETPSWWPCASAVWGARAAFRRSSATSSSSRFEAAS